MLKNKNQEQTGRSMVEMLGTLAIIGVLSVAGVAGFNTAINKYKANEILNGATMRATVVSNQLQADSSATPSLGEFMDNTVGGATFNTEVTKLGTDKFVISFSTEPTDEVLKQMKAISGTTGIVRGYNGTSLVFNNDLTTEARASDNNNQGATACGTTNTYCEGSGLCLEGTGKTCTCSDTRPACKKCNTVTGSYIIDSSKNNTRDTCEEGQVCDNGVCKVKPSASSYTNKTDCMNANYNWFRDDGCGKTSACYATLDEMPLSSCMSQINDYSSDGSFLYRDSYRQLVLDGVVYTGPVEVQCICN